MSGIHDGHRDRMKQQFLKDGLSEHMPPHKLLEMLLFYSIPRKDTNELAHLLIETFGSFSAVLDAPAEELIKIPGITQNTICLLKLIMPAARTYMDDRADGRTNVSGREDAAEYLSKKFIGRTVETVFLLCMDNKGRILSCAKLSEGDEISVGVSARSVVEATLKSHATAVMIAHNHPMGFAFPSPGDIKVTSDISTALFHIGVQFLDHIIVADGDYISMQQTPEYSHLFQ